ncbi:hypothetical protein DL766_009766 [Monosporascus sp. MC13-8B]|uniref:Uncharacterized protein n=1 Tax=Monosporascus cannonballus TaxID=155416 RepID=A0ABY0GZT7_9PEZI|nr:hypothetical protein DL762_007199 [Monosporascus cannonballus]RYO84566.1 hypothetical protein DL763_007418 [Monosporascus cannonballus]RYP14085.1 hypothetical protein DL766_009766 [Monosporascus sp. MC13-8B]
MGKKKTNGQATQAGNGPIAGPSLHPRNDTKKLVFRLTPIIQDRLLRNFDVESYTQPSQKAINKIIYILFHPYLAAAASRPLSQFDVYRLVQENHAETLSHIWSETSVGEASFWVGRGADTIRVESPAVKAVRAMPVVTVAYHVWTLWTLGAFSVRSAHQTFIGALTDAKLPKAFQMSLSRKAVLNRICFDTFRSFTEWIPGGLQSKEDIAKIVQQNFEALKDSMHALFASLDAEYKGRSTGAAGWNDQNMIAKLHVLWEDGVFTSGVSRQRPLAPPLNYRRKAVTRIILKSAQRESRELKQRNIYLAIRPFIEPHLDEVLTVAKISQLVLQCLETPTFLESISWEEATLAVTRLWKAKVFHDPAIRRRILGIGGQQMASRRGKEGYFTGVCKEAEGPIEVDVIETVGNAIQLCRVLKDEKRRVSLEKAENEIQAVSSSLDIHAAEVKQRASEQLEAFNNSARKGIPTYFQSPSFRQVKERAILDEAQRDFEKFRDTCDMKLLGVLKQLLDSSHEAYLIS